MTPDPNSRDSPARWNDNIAELESQLVNIEHELNKTNKEVEFIDVQYAKRNQRYAPMDFCNFWPRSRQTWNQ